jgi:hypothetical protein
MKKNEKTAPAIDNGISMDDLEDVIFNVEEAIAFVGTALKRASYARQEMKECRRKLLQFHRREEKRQKQLTKAANRIMAEVTKRTKTAP